MPEIKPGKIHRHISRRSIQRRVYDASQMRLQSPGISTAKVTKNKINYNPDLTSTPIATHPLNRTSPIPPSKAQHTIPPARAIASAPARTWWQCVHRHIRSTTGRRLPARLFWTTRTATMATATGGLHRPTQTPGSAAMPENAIRKMAAEPIFVFSSSSPSCERFGARSGVVGGGLSSSGEERLSGKGRAVKTGSRAAPIPEGAVTGFRTAKAFVSEIGGLDHDVESRTGHKEGQLVDGGRRMGTRDEEKKNCPTISKGDRAKSKGSAVQEETSLIGDIARVDEEKENTDSVLLENKSKLSRKTDCGEDLQEDVSEPKPKKRRKRSDGPKLKLDKKPAAKKEPVEKKQTNVKKGEVTKRGATAVEKSEKASFQMPPNLRTTAESSKYFEQRVVELASRDEAETTFTGLEKRTDDVAERAKDITAPTLAQTAILADPASRQPAGASTNSKRPADVLETRPSEDQLGSVLVAPAEDKPATYPDASKGAKAQAKKKRARSDADTTASKTPKLPKAKSPVKKKLATITAHAIARANVPECDLDLTLQCTPDGAPQNEDYPIFGIENVRKPHLLVSDAKKSTGKSGLQDGASTRKKKKSSTAKSKQVASVEPKLRSPESALRRMQRQDFLFGTSSQFVREQDPAFLRDLQVALKASESGADLREVSESDLPKMSASRASRTLPRASRQLWLAGAEGDGEDYQLRENLEKQLRQDESAEKAKTTLPQVEQERSLLGFVPIDGAASISGPTAKLDTILEESDGAKADEALPSLGIEGETDKTKAISTEEDSQEPKPKSKGSKLKLSSAPQSKPRLVFQNSLSGSSFSSHTAISEIISSHVASQAMQMSTKAASGKTVGSKQKVQKRQRQKSATSVKEGDETAPPKRKPGRPRKDATSASAAATKGATKKQKETKVTTNQAASNEQDEKIEAFVSIDDIEDIGIPQPPQQEDDAAPTTPKKVKNGRQDSDQDGFVPIDEIEDNDPPTPSPPRRHSPSVLAQLEFEDAPQVEDAIPENGTRKKRSAAAIAAAKARAEARARAQAEAQEQLFVLITRAVKSAPRSNDPKNPSWWEKILMYDPIVLEELTAWLNDGVLDAASVAKMASPGVEEEHDGNDHTVEGLDCLSNGKLDPSLVRKWCDRNSICSVSRDGSDWR